MKVSYISTFAVERYRNVGGILTLLVGRMSSIAYSIAHMETFSLKDKIFTDSIYEYVLF